METTVVVCCIIGFIKVDQLTITNLMLFYGILSNLNVYIESAMGVKLNLQNEPQSEFVEATTR